MVGWKLMYPSRVERVAADAGRGMCAPQIHHEHLLTRTNSGLSGMIDLATVYVIYDCVTLTVTVTLVLSSASEGSLEKAILFPLGLFAHVFWQLVPTSSSSLQRTE